MKVTHSGVTYDCATAVKCEVNKFIKLYDENGTEIASFDNISDFSDYTISGGSFTAPGSCSLPLPLFVFNLEGKTYCALNVKDGERVELLTSDHYENFIKKLALKLDYESPIFSGCLKSSTLESDNKQIINATQDNRVFIGNAELSELYFEVNGNGYEIQNIIKTLNNALSTANAAYTALSNYLPLSGGETGRIRNKKEYGVDPNESAFDNAPFVSYINLNENKTNRAGYGFHNGGFNGAFLYLDTDGYLKYVMNGNADCNKILIQDDFTVSGNDLIINWL